MHPQKNGFLVKDDMVTKGIENWNLGWISHKKWFGVHREMYPFFYHYQSLFLIFFKSKRMGELVTGQEGGERGIM